MNDLFTRLFVNFRTSLEGTLFAVLAWLSSNGFEVSQDRKLQLVGLIGAAAAAIWKFFSKDPVPEGK